MKLAYHGQLQGLCLYFSLIRLHHFILYCHCWPKIHQTGNFLTSQSVLLLLLSRFSRAQLCATPQTAAHKALRPWDSPGKNTGVGCLFLLQCMKVKSESEVHQSYLTLSDPMDCSLPGSSVHGIFQARVLEWGAIAFSREWILEVKIQAHGLSMSTEIYLLFVDKASEYTHRNIHSCIYIHAHR